MVKIAAAAWAAVWLLSATAAYAQAGPNGGGPGPQPGPTVITLAPGLGTSASSFNGTGTAQTVTTGQTLATQGRPLSETANYTLNADCTAGVLCDAAQLVLADGSAAITFKAPNPVGTLAPYQMADQSGHGYTLTTVGGTATFTGCVSGSPTSLTIPAYWGVRIVDMGSSANSYTCVLQPQNGVTVGSTALAGGTGNEIFYESGGVLSQIATADSAVLVTNGAGVPSFGTTLPSGLTIPGYNASITWPASGDLMLSDGGNAPTAYAGTSGSTNQFLTGLSAAGAGTYAQPAFTNLSGSASTAQLETNLLAALAAELTPTSDNCIVGSGSAWTSAACPGGGGGSLTVTDGTHSVASTTTLTFGNGFVVGGSAGAATVNATVADNTKTTSYTVAAADMGNSLNLTGSGATLTLPAESSTIFAPGMGVNISTAGATGNWTVTNSTGLTPVGLNATTLPPGTSGTLVANADGLHLDFYPGMQAPSTTVLGGVLSSAAGTNQFATGLNTSGALTYAQPACGSLSNSGTACQVNTGTSGATLGELNANKTDSGNNTYSGTDNFTGTFEVGGDAMTFPAAAATLAALGISQSFTAGQSVTPVALTAGTTVSVNAALSNNFTLTPAQNFTLANPTNLLAGETLNFWITQDSTGSRVLTLGTDYQAPGGSATIVLSTAASTKDLLTCVSDTTSTLTCNLLKAVAH